MNLFRKPNLNLRTNIKYLLDNVAQQCAMRICRTSAGHLQDIYYDQGYELQKMWLGYSRREMCTELRLGTFSIT